MARAVETSRALKALHRMAVPVSPPKDASLKMKG